MILKIIILFFAIVSWLAVVVSVHDAVLTMSVRSWVPTKANVLEYKTNYVSLHPSEINGAMVFDPNIKYEYNFKGTTYSSSQVALRKFGRTYSGPHLYELLGSSEPSIITVYVNPNNPSSAIIDRGNLLNEIILSFAGVLLAIVATFLAYAIFKPK